jgi:segregation and condensation protein B
MNKEINLLEEETCEEIEISEVVEQIDQQEHHEETRAQLKRIIEAVLFASPDPVPFKKLRELVDSIEVHKTQELKELLDELAQEYDIDQRAFRLEEIAQGYVLRTRPEYSIYLDLVFKNKKVERLSASATEVLAIIAYRQPMTRPQLESIRGVDSSGVVASLLERELIETKGKAEVAGRPTLYGTTSKFLQYYGLNDVKDLPGYEENRKRLEQSIKEEKAHEGAEASAENAESNEAVEEEIETVSQE